LPYLYGLLELSCIIKYILNFDTYICSKILKFNEKNNF